jgi:hypothetical protein
MKTTYKNYIVSEKWIDNVYRWNMTCKHYKINVYNKENKKRTSFDFYMGELSKGIKKEYDLLNAFYCFLSDGVSGLDSFEDFCFNFGYDTDSIKAYGIYKECKKSAVKIQRVITCNIYDLLNELSESYS